MTIIDPITQWPFITGYPKQVRPIKLLLLTSKEKDAVKQIIDIVDISMANLTQKKEISNE